MKELRLVKVAAILLLLAVSLAFGCDKESGFKSKGEITGIDARACACCGGYFIKIDTALYLAPSLPADFKYDFTKATFPIPVLLDWDVNKTQCASLKWIDVYRIALVQ